MESEINNTCENCKYYQRFYIKKPTCLKYAGRGYCNKLFLKPREKRQIPNITDCTSHEPIGDKDAEGRETMKAVIRKMRKQLAEIELMFNDEE